MNSDSRPSPSRFAVISKAILLVASLVTYWLLMMPLHELGHVLHALATGGRIVRVVLHPLAFSRTDVSPNPSPLVVVWGGPLWGTLLPIGIWVVWKLTRLPGAKWIQGLAAFCGIANGLYIASGAFISAGDTEDLLRLHVPAWVLMVAGVPAVAIGFWIAHRMGRHLGLAELPSRTARSYACVASAGVVITATAMVLLNRFTSLP